MARFELTLLGSCSARLDGEPVRGFDSDKSRLLLAYLAVESDRPHARERLAEMFWPGHPPQAAHASLRTALSNLRHLLTLDPAGLPLLDSDREFVQLLPGSECWIDAAAFEEEIEQGRLALASAADLLSAVEHDRAALSLYHGDFLEGFALKDCPEFDDWCYFVRERLLRKASTALRRLAEHAECCGELEQALAYAQRSIALEPWQEEAHRRVMRLYALSGQRPAALEQYEACKRILLEELDVQPADETTHLYEQIRDEKIAAAAQEPSRGLPVYLTPFVGRQEELEEIASHLQEPECRLLTLLGPGGSGKTRLAVETAGREQERYADGVCFVPLAAAEKCEAIPPAILSALGAANQILDLQEFLFNTLQDKEMLLVLDNFEQLLPGGADLLPGLLAAAPRLKLLVTSRERLHLSFELIYNVAAMGMPSNAEESCARQFDAVRLFCAAAQRKRGAAPGDEEMKDVIRICRQVGGMPLAIEIAGSWTRVLSCAEIAAEIEHSLAFLHSDARELQARHRSVQAVFETTWGMLSEQEQAVFRRLSVFRGGFTRAAAEQVAGASLPVLAALLDKCLVSRRPSGRFDLHELLRQFGAEKLAQDAADEEQTHSAHSQFFSSLWSGADLSGPQMRAYLAQIEADLDNVRAAWQRSARRGDYAAAEQLYEVLTTSLGAKERGAEQVILIEETLQLFPAPPPEPFLAYLLAEKGTNPASHRKDGRAARRALDQSLEISQRLGLKDLYAYDLMTLGNLEYAEDYRQGIRDYQQSVAIFEELGEERRLAYAYHWLGMMWYASGFLKQSDICLHRSLEYSRSSQSAVREAGVLYWLTTVKLVQGDLGAAKEYYHQLEAQNDRLGIQWTEAACLCLRGLTAWREGQTAEAVGCFDQVLRRLQERYEQGENEVAVLKTHFHQLFCQVLESFGQYALMYRQACQGVEAYHLMGVYPQNGEPDVEPLEWLGLAEMHLGRYAEARAHLTQFIRGTLSIHSPDWALFGLYHFAELLVMEEDSPERRQQALALLTLVLNHPRLEGVDYPPAILGRPALPTLAACAAQVASKLGAEEAAAARERGRGLVLEDVVAGLAVESR